jgi:hypothetical protein
LFGNVRRRVSINGQLVNGLNNSVLLYKKGIMQTVSVAEFSSDIERYLGIARVEELVICNDNDELFLVSP